MSIPEDLKIRKMKVVDFEIVSKLEKEIFPCPWSKRQIFRILTEDKLAFPLIAEIYNEIVGYAFAWIVYDEVHIGNLAVKEGYRRMKIGTRLINYLISEASKKGGKFFYLEVRKSNEPAINLYEKFGFIPLSIRKKYYTDNEEDAVVMGKSLNGVLQNNI